MSAYSIATRGLAGRKIPQGVLAPMNALLFGASEPGAWYDPSDLSTLFQDSAGTTPVTAVEQFVGLILDKSKGLALGVEIAPNNGTFVASTGWVVGAGTAISGGLATSTGVVPGTTTVTSGVLGAIGKWYQVTVSVSALSAGQFRPVLFGNVLTSNLIGTTGVFTFTVLASSTVIYLQAYNVTTTGALSGFSVRELSGNHASQATSTKRPKYSRRVNRVTNTGFSGGVAGAPGTAATGFTQSVTGTPSTYYPASVYDASSKSLQAVGGVGDRLQFSQTISIGAYENILASVNVDNVYTAAAVYQHISAFSVPAGAAVSFYLDGISVLGSATLPSGAHTISALVTNAGTSGTFILRFGAGLQVGLTVASDITFSNPRAVPLQSTLPFQRVNTPTDYDADPAKFPAYLLFDGVDDALQTANIDFTGTDKMTVWAGVTKLSDAGTGLLVELSATSNTNDGSFKILSPELPGPRISSSSRGTAVNAINQSAISGVLISPDSHAVSASHDIYASATTLRVDGVVVSTATGNKGTGNYGNYPLYIGARAGTSLFFNGRLYSLIARGAATPLPQIEAVETLIRQKMRLP